MRRTVGEPGMPLHGKWLGPGALGRSASIRAGIVWASFGASFKDCMLSAFPSISKNLTGLTGQEFHGTAYHDPEDKTRRYNKQSYGRCQAWGHDFLGHRFGWGPHRFACLSHPCRVSGPFLINLIVLNSDGGSYASPIPNILAVLIYVQHPVAFDISSSTGGAGNGSEASLLSGSPRCDPCCSDGRQPPLTH